MSTRRYDKSERVDLTDENIHWELGSSLSYSEYLGLDKLLFRATAIRIDGPSYRLDQHKKRKAARASNKPEDGAGHDRESSS